MAFLRADELHVRRSGPELSQGSSGSASPATLLEPAHFPRGPALPPRMGAGGAAVPARTRRFLGDSSVWNARRDVAWE